MPMTFASATRTRKIPWKAWRSRRPNMQATASSDKNGVTVTAFEVDHGALIKPAYGYRIDYEGRSVILSGDTRYSENLEKHAQGATLVVHEVASANPEYLDKTPIVKYIMAHRRIAGFGSHLSVPFPRLMCKGNADRTG